MTKTLHNVVWHNICINVKYFFIFDRDAHGLVLHFNILSDVSNQKSVKQMSDVKISIGHILFFFFLYKLKQKYFKKIWTNTTHKNFN